MRRLSVSHSDDVVAVISSKNVDVSESESDLDSTKPVFADDIDIDNIHTSLVEQKAAELSYIIHDNRSESIVNGSENSPNEMLFDVAVADKLANLEVIINDLKTLKCDNSNLCALISSLHADNIALRAEVNELKTGFYNLLSNMHLLKANDNSNFVIARSAGESNDIKYTSACSMPNKTTTNKISKLAKNREEVVAKSNVDIVVGQTALSNNKTAITATNTYTMPCERFAIENSTSSIINTHNINAANTFSPLIDLTHTGACDKITNSYDKSFAAVAKSNTITNTITNTNTLPNTHQIESEFNAANDNANWMTSNKKPRKNKMLIGTRLGNELDALPIKKWLHLSSFKNSVNEQHIVYYLSKHTGISADHFSCFKLVKKGTINSELKHINFKLGVSVCFYDQMLDSSLWPANIKVWPFLFLDGPKNQIAKASQPLNAPALQ